MVLNLPSGSNSMVESQPSKLLVAGSILVSRSKITAILEPSSGHLTGVP